MLKIKNLRVSTAGKEIIRGLDLIVPVGKLHVLMGPNGAGKSSLAMALMGHPSFKTHGQIVLDGKDISVLAPDARARAGLFLAFQSPQEVEGLKVSNFVRKAIAAKDGDSPRDLDAMMRAHEFLAASAQSLGMDKSFLSRELNVGFSGGEKKRLEMLQMLTLAPKLAILDEIDSGLDVDGIRSIAKAISSLRDGKRSFLVITHYPRLLKYVKPDAVHVLSGGKIVRSGTAALVHEIEEKGYSAYEAKNRITHEV